MKFYNVSDIKLRVVLSAADCTDYGIDLTKTDYVGKEIRNTIRDIMLRANEECGFDAEDDKILVQLYPLPGDECEILVTKLVYPSVRESSTLSSSRGVALMESKRGVYRFNTFEELLSAVRAVYRDDVIADLYLDDVGRYYISVTEDVCDGISEFEIFIEYAERIHALPIAVISEYGRLLAKDNAFDYITKEMTINADKDN